MSEIDCPGNLHKHGRCRTGIFHKVGQFLGQRAVGHEFHREVLLAVMLANLVDRQDIRMVEVGSGFSLGLEASHIRSTGKFAGLDHLEGNFSVKRHLTGPEDHTHAAPSDLRKQFVIPEITHRPKRSTRGSFATSRRQRGCRLSGRSIGRCFLVKTRVGRKRDIGGTSPAGLQEPSGSGMSRQERLDSLPKIGIVGASTIEIGAAGRRIGLFECFTENRQQMGIGVVHGVTCWGIHNPMPRLQGKCAKEFHHFRVRLATTKLLPTRPWRGRRQPKKQQISYRASRPLLFSLFIHPDVKRDFNVLWIAKAVNAEVLFQFFTTLSAKNKSQRLTTTIAEYPVTFSIVKQELMKIH